jgi:ceramide glucosyltransferase
VVVGAAPVENVNEARGVRDFLGRYARWSVMQRKAVGPAAHAAQALLNPVLLGTAGLAAAPSPRAAGALAAICAAKIAVDGASARLLRPGGFGLAALAVVPAKDLLFGFAWAHGLFHDEVCWRGNRLRVLDGTRLVPVEEPAEEPLAGSAEA